MIFGIGTDLCQIERIKEVYTKHADRFVDRILTEEEKNASRLNERFLARRFAAKEACAKALGSGIGEQVSFQDLTVTRVEGERPKVALSERVQQVFPNITVHLSLSDDARLRSGRAWYPLHSIGTSKT